MLKVLQFSLRSAHCAHMIDVIDERPSPGSAEVLSVM
jgi:hypothetical protein